MLTFALSHNKHRPLELADKEPLRKNKKRNNRQAKASVLSYTPCNHRTTGRRRSAWSLFRYARNQGTLSSIAELLRFAAFP